MKGMKLSSEMGSDLTSGVILCKGTDAPQAVVK
jgi:hypothetical protein